MKAKEHAIEHLLALWHHFRLSALRTDSSDLAITDTIKNIGGADPQSFEAFLRDQLPALIAQPSRNPA